KLHVPTLIRADTSAVIIHGRTPSDAFTLSLHDALPICESRGACVHLSGTRRSSSREPPMNCQEDSPMAMQTQQSFSGFIASEPQLTYTEKGDARLFVKVGKEHYRREQ